MHRMARPISTIAAINSLTNHGHNDSSRWASCVFVDNLAKAYETIIPPTTAKKGKRSSLQAQAQKHLAPN